MMMWTGFGVDNGRGRSPSPPPKHFRRESSPLPLTTHSPLPSPPPYTRRVSSADNSRSPRSSPSFIPQSFNSPSGRRLSSGLCCVVCGDTSSGKHYGILACNGCSGFFKRSVRRKLIYRCQAGTGQCIVDKAHRNQCQACRLKRCLSMGMNKDAVQNERQPRNTATLRPESLCEMDQERALREAAVAVGVFGPLLGPRGPLTMGQHPFQQQQQHHHQSTTPRDQSPPPQGPQNSQINSSYENGNDDDDSIDVTSDDNNSPLSKPLVTTTANHLGSGGHSNGNGRRETSPSSSSSGGGGCPNSQISNHVVNYSNSVDIPSVVYNPAHETIYETSARLLFMAVKWAKNLPSFASLPFRDQVILLEEAWADLFLLNAIQWCMPGDASLFSPADHVSLPNGKAVQVAGDLRALNDALARFRSIGVDPAEFACLKAIALFRSDTRGLKDPLQVENLQDQAQVMLCQHARGAHPAQPARFGRLLLLLPLPVRHVPPQRIEVLFFHRTIGNTPMEKVLCDMFKN